MKVKSKFVYWGVAAVLILAMYLLVNPLTPGFVSTHAKDVSRFGPDSIDVQMGSGMFTFEQPNLLAPAPTMKPLLLFPPSEQDLERLSGPTATVQ
jgi:hypothetical protein